MTLTIFDEMNFGLWLGAFFATFGFVRILISCKLYMEASKYQMFYGGKMLKSKLCVSVRAQM